MNTVQAGSGSSLAFVAVVFLLYWSCSSQRLLRMAVVLAANYLFCVHFGLVYLVLIPACSALDYFVGLGLVRFRGTGSRKLLLGLSVAANLILMIAPRHARSIAGWDWAFPLGLSFYALQSLTYTIDLYRRDGEGCPSLLTYLASASFFPTLQAGPVTRLTALVKQFTGTPSLSREDGGRALFLVALGVLKKTLIADYLAQNLVNRVFDTPKLYSGGEVLVAVYAYSLQLYYDFSAYTDIARGFALLLGIRLPINFDRPYLASNLTEFWRRWHISFSNWLRDYLYFSLPGKRTKVMPYVNLVVTMLLAGLWHGIAWPFAVWGLLHGAALAATRAWLRQRGRPPQPNPWRRALAIFCTYQFVCFTWLFFRSRSLSDAGAMLERIASLTAGFPNISVAVAAVSLASAAALLAGHRLYSRAMETFARCPFYVHAVILVIVAAAIQLAAGHGSAPFIYSRF
jgi:D-alanyl-lipoteichoic acid acyltransferase DltB (MBOAT superfamily)